MNAKRYARRVAAMVASAALMGGAGAFATGSLAIADSDRVTATTGVNVRSGPGTSYDVLGGLYPGYTVTVKGSARSGWTPVTYNGREAWVSSKYLRKVGTSTKAAPATAAIRSIRTSTALNVRSGPGTNHSVITVLQRGTVVSTTGKKSNGFSEITFRGQLRWVATQYLQAVQPTERARGTRTMYATTALDIRSVSSDRYRRLDEIPRGTKVTVTGVQQQGRAQIVWNKGIAWVTAKYLTATAPRPSATPPPAGAKGGSTLPKISGTRYATTALMIRTTPNSDFRNLGDVPRGTKLSITGVTKNGRAQIVYKNAVRWVTAQYLSKSSPSTRPSNSINGSGLSGLRSETKELLDALRVRFPQVTTYYGVRADAIPDHPSGRALDAMLPNYRSASSQALGQDLANWVRANARSLDVEYIIFNQRIWSVARANEGWRYMADRGSDNANHKNHVHVTVN